jgi:hypothetical protein
VAVLFGLAGIFYLTILLVPLMFVVVLQLRGGKVEA